MFVTHGQAHALDRYDGNEGEVLQVEQEKRRIGVRVVAVWVCLSATGSWFGCEEVCFLPPTASHPPTLICRTKAGTIEETVVQKDEGEGEAVKKKEGESERKEKPLTKH